VAHVVAELAARGLTFDYPGPHRALSGVELELARGELLALLGPNGSGKSTLLRLLCGLLAPTAGTVELAGRPLGRCSSRERARSLAFVPQALESWPELDVFAFVLGGRYARRGRWEGFLGRASGADRAAVEGALEEADAGDLARRRLSTLSLGQRQRVLLARALAQEAPLLLFDEPTAALDPGHQVRVFALIEALVRRDRAALVATHELNLASRFATRCLVLERGRLAAAGPPGEVLRRAVLAPVFGRDLLFASAPGGRPLVLPWPADEGAE
jgi:iron complex transport system ATP-binding protein